jgi:hypothetical protein
MVLGRGFEELVTSVTKGLADPIVSKIAQNATRHDTGGSLSKKRRSKQQCTNFQHDVRDSLRDIVLILAILEFRVGV